MNRLLSTAMLCTGVAALPSGTYCAYKSVVVESATVQMNLTPEEVHFRVDGDIHWADCVFAWEEKENGLFAPTEPHSDCFQRFLDAQTGGEVPKFQWNEESDKLTITAYGILPIVGIDVRLTKAQCEDLGDVNPIRQREEL